MTDMMYIDPKLIEVCDDYSSSDRQNRKKASTLQDFEILSKLGKYSFHSAGDGAYSTVYKVR